jgi:hypothetical protein
MNKTDFRKRDGLLGLLVSFAMLVWAGSEFKQSLGRKASNIAVRRLLMSCSALVSVTTSAPVAVLAL